MNIAFIPVRGGSKSIPLKNIKMMCNKPLVYWTLKAACNCKKINKVFVSTDSPIIKEVVESFQFANVEVISRSAESASDIASTESAMLEFAQSTCFDNIVLIQATSPLLETKDLDKGFEVFYEKGVDSVLSVVKQKRFIWKKSKDGFSVPDNYDIYRRPRRQEFEGYYVENGAFYINSRKNLLITKNRISGNIKTVEMSEDTFWEIDEPSDWCIVESLLMKRINKFAIPRIKMFLTDCDGCLTDGGMYYSEKGDELKKFNTKDGVGMTLLKERGIITGIITGESTQINANRFKKLQLDILEQGCKNKLNTIKEICAKYSIDLSEVTYIGDDINDLMVIENVGFGCCPVDASEVIKNRARYISSKKGGDGVIREVCDLLLQSLNFNE